MSKKLTVKNAFGKTVYCILSDNQPYEEQLMDVLGLKAGFGFSVSMDSKSISVMDYFHGEERGHFDIISLKKSNEEPSLYWHVCE